MTRIYGYAEMLYNLMPTAAEDDVCPGRAIPGFVEGQVLPNPYTTEQGDHSPIGQVLCSMGVDVEWLEQMSIRHVRDCEDTEDPDEPCVVCAEGADNSIYMVWVQQWLAEEYDIAFSDAAHDLLWSAETSGLTLNEFLVVQRLREES